jgi:hypothetical protein
MHVFHDEMLILHFANAREWRQSVARAPSKTRDAALMQKWSRMRDTRNSPLSERYKAIEGARARHALISTIGDAWWTEKAQASAFGSVGRIDNITRGYSEGSAANGCFWQYLRGLSQS